MNGRKANDRVESNSRYTRGCLQIFEAYLAGSCSELMRK
jgi:hypothetical protein